MSVIFYVDRIMVWDTGSTDKTVEIVEEIASKYPGKVELRKFGGVGIDEHTAFRQKMLEQTTEEWVVILDGDEVWWDGQIKELVEIMKCGKYESVVSRYVNLVGDIYHYQDEKYAKYNIHGNIGNYTIRAMNKRKIKGLYTSKPHGQQGFFDGDDRLIQDRHKKNIYFSKEVGFMHFTHLVRSASRKMDKQVVKRGFKYRVELGLEFPLDYYYPEVFFVEKLSIVSDVWEKRGLKYEVKALMLEIPRMVKRGIYKGGVGY